MTNNTYPSRKDLHTCLLHALTTYHCRTHHCHMTMNNLTTMSICISLHTPTAHTCRRNHSKSLKYYFCHNAQRCSHILHHTNTKNKNKKNKKKQINGKKKKTNRKQETETQHSKHNTATTMTQK